MIKVLKKYKVYFKLTRLRWGFWPLYGSAVWTVEAHNQHDAALIAQCQLHMEVRRVARYQWDSQVTLVAEVL